MAWSDYWGGLTSRQRIGFAVGAAVIVIATLALATWLLRDPYVPLASELSTEQLNELARELERAKLSYRVETSGDAIAVPRSELGKARAVAATPFDASGSVGLELFQETDFSTSDFAQKINYQRALQGELTRTVESMAGVRRARVHVILPDSGLFKRSTAKATAAVSVALEPGKSLSRAQVLGIQRLVAASVPEMKLEDVVVLDESGASLSRTATEGAGDLSAAQLDLKRQADQYLESKLSRLLQELVPQGVATLSVDTTLDEKQARVTTEEPIAAPTAKGSGHSVGVLVKERQSQRGRPAALVQADGYAPESDSTDWEYEYKVGNRVEQTLSAPGSIKRVSVAVALQGAPAELSSDAVEELVAHAVGIDRKRGDSVAVLLLPAAKAAGIVEPLIEAGTPRGDSHAAAAPVTPPQRAHSVPRGPMTLLVAALAVLALTIGSWTVVRARRQALSNSDEAAVLAKVREWLNEGGGNGRS